MRTASTTRRLLHGFAIGIALTLLTALPALGHTPDGGLTADGVDTGVVEYEGELVDLAESWGDAQACLIWEERGVSRCFDSEAEMDRFVAALEGRGTVGDVAYSLEKAGTPAAERVVLRCPSSLKLYDGTSYTGAVLQLRDRKKWQNLSRWGFNQRTSSYKISACSAYFADYNNGGGGWYPTYLTSAYNQWTSMTGGWNNDVSSVYIK